ncbi:lamin tail domain-containing protein [Rubrivirga sp. IMCC45206]|uniref:lamin tail domain-containing protein n=1 Tax=Rubrivirga sp. IMCC45206 TaxID=3391614 RepID=UPI00398FE111
MHRVALALLALAGLPALAQAPAPGDLVVNEVMYDPPAPQPSGNEWIEMLNASDGPRDVGGLVVTDGGGTSAEVPAGTVLAPGGFLVLTRDGGAFAAAYPDVPFVDLDGFPALNNAGDRVAIVLSGAEIDAVPYVPSWGGSDASLERIDPYGPSSQASNFATSTDPSGGTPGAQNSVFAQDTDPPALVSADALDAQTVLVTFSEPVGASSAETASNYSLDGGIGTPTLAMIGDAPTEVVLALATPLAGPRTYTLTVQGIADVRGNVLTSATATFFFGQGAVPAARDLVINEFLYDPPSGANPGEYVELFNRTDQPFDLRDFTLNDSTGDPEPITTGAIFVEPGGYAVIVDDGAAFAAVFPGVAFVEQPGWSALNNAGDDIVLAYLGQTVDALSYLPSWGGTDASLERKDPDGPSSVAANWATTTNVSGGTPGAQNSQFMPDVAGPALVSATASPDGRTVFAALDEPATPASVTAAAFSVSGTTVTDASYTPESTTVTLALSAPLVAGTSTVTATGLTDLLGNTTASSSTTVDFVPDTVAPAIARVTALSASRLRVAFSEPVTEASATNAGAYAVETTAVAGVTATDTADGGVEAVEVVLAGDLAEPDVYTLAVSGLTDLAGNTTASTSARFFVGTPDTPGAGDLAITEIMYDPTVGSAGEYVEVRNTSAGGVFSLDRVTLDDGDGDGDPLVDEPAVLLPGEVVAVVRDADGFRVAFPDAPLVVGGTVISLSNSGEAIVLRAAGTVLDSVVYQPEWHRIELDDATGISLERRDASADPNVAANWSSSLAPAGGTPSAPNSVAIAGTPVERDAGLTITSPFAPTLGEAGRITYTLSTEAALVRARVYDGGGRLVRELEPGRLSGSTATLTWDGTGDDGRPLRAGIYIVLVEAIDVEGGTTEALRGAVVLARPRE